MSEKSSNGVVKQSHSLQTASNIQKQLAKILGELKPTQKSIHDSSSWFLKATADKNLEHVPSLAKIWKKTYDFNHENYESRLSLMYFINDVLQFGKRSTMKYEECFTSYIVEILSDLLNNHDEFKKNGKGVSKIVDIWLTRSVFNHENRMIINKLYKKMTKNDEGIDIMNIVNKLKGLEATICEEKKFESKIKDLRVKYKETLDSSSQQNEKLINLKKMLLKSNKEIEKIQESISVYKKVESAIFKLVSNLKQEYTENGISLNGYESTLSEAEESLKRLRKHMASLPDMSALFGDIS